MREIVFRGKRIDNGEWVEGNFYESQISGCYILENKLLATVGGRHSRATIRDKLIPYEVDPSTVGQYTGLKDKNGKRIFEGDIVKLWRSVGAKGDCRRAYRCPLVVEYCDLWAQFVVADNPMKEQYSLFDFQAIEVIGNIHDNPEMLEVR